jgi:hypothetical protein
MSGQSERDQSLKAAKVIPDAFFDVLGPDPRWSMRRVDPPGGWAACTPTDWPAFEVFDTDTGRVVAEYRPSGCSWFDEESEYARIHPRVLQRIAELANDS